jgi:aspartyl-tRNA(Asn)/glutamyl-tRNA(Gln) amidotransferase subunit A
MSGTASPTIQELAPRIKSLAVSPVDIVRSCLARIEAGRDGNAFIAVRSEEAVREAQHAEAEIRAGRYKGPLHGVPVAVKDLVDVEGMLTTSGSAVPAPTAAKDAPVVSRLRDAGAVIIGKTNLHEFAFGTTSEESAFGPVRHPKDPSRSAGGSSGGSAAALAGGMCYGAVGTDTGGSIRIPAAACGIVGLKPTLGELTCEGVVPLSTTLDHVGPMALTVFDVGLLYQAMKGAHVRGVAPAGGRLTIGVARGYFMEPLDADVRAALARARGVLAKNGHALVDVEIRHAEWTPDAYLHIVLPEAARFHAVRLEEHADRYSPGVRMRLEMGRYVLAEDYVRAMRLREYLTHEVDRTLRGCDALLLPALAIPAATIGASTVEVGGQSQPVRAAMLKLTQLFNMTGHPAIAIPAGAGADGLPRGLQLVGHRGRTERLLDVAAAVELETRKTYIVAGPGSVGGGTG